MDNVQYIINVPRTMDKVQHKNSTMAFSYILYTSNWVSAQVASAVKTVFLISKWRGGGGVQLGPLVTTATNKPIVPAPGDHDDAEIGGIMIGRRNRSTRRKTASAPLCPP
jgi:hypothetical protein